MTCRMVEEQGVESGSPLTWRQQGAQGRGGDAEASSPAPSRAYPSQSECGGGAPGMSSCDRCSGWYCYSLEIDTVPLELVWSRPAAGRARGHRFHADHDRGSPIASPGRLSRRVARRAKRAGRRGGKRRTRIAEQVSERWPSRGEVVSRWLKTCWTRSPGLVEWPTALRGSFDPEFSGGAGAGAHLSDENTPEIFPSERR